MAKANTYPVRSLANVYGEDVNGAFGKSPGILSNLNAAGGPSVSNDQTQGYSVGSLWANSNTAQLWIARSVATGAAVWTLLEFSDHPGYVVSNWYVPYGNGNFTSGSAPSAGSIRLIPGYIKERITINALGLRITTASAGGNVQAAIYAASATTKLPTGTPLVSSASMSTTTSGANVSAAVSVQLEPGLYWFAINADNAVAAYATPGTTPTFTASTIGSATQASNLASGSGLIGLSATQAFGTWPDLTSATFAELIGVTTIAVVQFKVGSVP